MPQDLCFYYLDENSKPLVLTTEEAIAFSHCEGCRHSTSCLYHEYNGPFPRTITQTKQQGPMTIQQQIPNPELIEITCRRCPCGSDGVCLRQPQGWCQNQEPKEEYYGRTIISDIQDTD